MARLSDLIESYIKKLLLDSSGFVEVQRNELAQIFSCVPSQINYVLNTRFKTEHGYLVETRRGGGGYVRIVKVSFNRESDLLTMINESIGDKISQQRTEGILQRFLDERMLTVREFIIIKSVINHGVSKANPEGKDYFRASMLKVALLASFDQ